MIHVTLVQYALIQVGSVQSCF